MIESLSLWAKHFEEESMYAPIKHIAVTEMRQLIDADGQAVSGTEWWWNLKKIRQTHNSIKSA